VYNSRGQRLVPDLGQGFRLPGLEIGDVQLSVLQVINHF
jgi:hypothetical protein